MTTCSDIDRLAAALTAGSLSSSERTALAGHLAGCAACRERLAARDPLALAGLEAPPPPPPPADLAARIHAAAAPELARRRAVSPVRRWWDSLTPGLRLAAAALWLVGLLGGWLLAGDLLRPAPPPTPTAAGDGTLTLLAGQPQGSLVACYRNLLDDGGP